RPTRARRHRDARLGYAARRIGKLLPAAAHGRCAAVYAVVFQQCGRRVACNAGSETECDPYSMTGRRRETTSRGDVTRRRGGTAFGPSYTSADLLGVSTLVFRTGLGALGATAKYARETVGGARVDAWAGDVGLAIAVFDLMALGVSVQNIGGDFGPAAGGLHLPRRTRAGFTLNYVDPQGTLRLL